MVVLQLAASQFSPRILRTFFGDRLTQITIGAYVGTFVYSISCCAPSARTATRASCPG